MEDRCVFGDGCVFGVYRRTPLHSVLGDRRPLSKFSGEVVALQRLLERASPHHIRAPGRPWVGDMFRTLAGAERELTMPWALSVSEL